RRAESPKLPEHRGPGAIHDDTAQRRVGKSHKRLDSRHQPAFWSAPGHRSTKRSKDPAVLDASFVLVDRARARVWLTDGKAESRTRLRSWEFSSTVEREGLPRAWLYQAMPDWASNGENAQRWAREAVALIRQLLAMHPNASSRFLDRECGSATRQITY